MIFLTCAFDVSILLLLLLGFFGSPSQCMEFHCGDNKIIIIKKKSLKKETTNVYLVIPQVAMCFLSDISCCVSFFCSSSLHSESVHSISLQHLALGGGGTYVPVQILMKWESTSDGVWGFCRSVGEKESPFSIRSLFLISNVFWCVSNFRDTNF